MFAPDHQQAADELVRVCKPGGTIALASWTPDGFIGELFRTVAKHVPPPAGVRSPMLWGTEAHLRELFGERISSLTVQERTFTWRFRSAEELVEFFRTWYGPTLKAFAGLGDDGAAGRSAMTSWPSLDGSTGSAPERRSPSRRPTRKRSRSGRRTEMKRNSMTAATKLVAVVGVSGATLVVGPLPAARDGKAPRIVAAAMQDVDGDARADRSGSSIGGSSARRRP